MRTTKLQHGVYAAVLLSTLGISACRLEDSPILSFGSLTPEVYCPGDQLNASYDFLRTDTCPAGVDCSSYQPNVSLTSTTGLFAPHNYPRAYSGSFLFPSAGSSVSVVFNVDRNPVMIPTDRFDSDGRRIFLERGGYRSPETWTSTLFDGRQQTINHIGMCLGASPGYSVGEAWTAPEVSSRLVGSELCNTSSVPIIATVTFRDAPGEPPPMDIALGIRECRGFSSPGVLTPPTPVRISARPQMADLSARCTAVDAGTPPRSLSTRLSYTCRM